MAENEKSSGKVVAAGLVGGTGAAILTYFLTKGRKAEAAPLEPGGATVFTPDEETWNLLVGILDGIVKQNSKLDDLINAINSLTVSLGGQPLLENPKGGVTDRAVNQTVGIAVQLPDYKVPYGMRATVKALNTNASPCRVAFSKVDAENATAGWPLIPNEGRFWKIDNMNRLWVCFAAPNDGVAWSVEQE